MLLKDEMSLQITRQRKQCEGRGKASQGQRCVHRTRAVTGPRALCMGQTSCRKTARPPEGGLESCPEDQELCPSREGISGLWISIPGAELSSGIQR